jgi:hypothetical protein
MADTELEIFTKQQLSLVVRHLARLGYKISSGGEPFSFRAVHPETVDIKGNVLGGLVIFSSLWTSSEYAAQNYTKYLTWVNALNSNSLAVKFSINQVGTLSMQLCYFGEYETDAFDVFYLGWREDIQKVWLSEARDYFLT